MVRTPRAEIREDVYHIVNSYQSDFQAQKYDRFIPPTHTDRGEELLHHNAKAVAGGSSGD